MLNLVAALPLVHAPLLIRALLSVTSSLGLENVSQWLNHGAVALGPRSRIILRAKRHE